ncbi:hypothetical protein AB0J55_15885 [Amycolatopsis sp. NPDC049688]|uniref:hypothetical protein n=1 Tax=Amycolatopsis sp. NPDC049688 TaxID=3154733 RepID=UPI003436C62C
MDDERAIDFVLNGEQHRLSRAQVLSAAGLGAPEPIRTHWVSIGEERWPPRQIFERALGVPRTDFISHYAIRQLRRLGFATSPLPHEPGVAAGAGQPEPAGSPAGRSDLGTAVKSFIDLHEFFGREDLASRVSRLEDRLEGADRETVEERVAPEGFTDALLRGALLVRQHAGRVNDLIHAAMIVRALPKILEPGERIVRRPSLASGNDGSRTFDLETDRRVAEFKAAEWKGRDSMRKRMLVADLVGLVLGRGDRRAELYVLGSRPIDFLRTSTSTVEWALGRSSPHLRQAYEQRFGSAALTIGQFTAGPAAGVVLRDLEELIG